MITNQIKHTQNQVQGIKSLMSHICHFDIYYDFSDEESGIMYNALVIKNTRVKPLMHLLTTLIMQV